MDAVERRARVHGRGTLHRPRLDGVDRRLPVRIGAAPVRRHRCAGVPRSRTRTHADAHGPPPHAHGRPRPRLQQRQHLRRALADDARGTHRRRPVGSQVLRAGAQGERRRPGAAMDLDSRRRVHLLVQRRALVVRRHHSIPARARARPRARASPRGRAGRAGQPALAAGRARARDRHLQRLLRPPAWAVRRSRARGAREPVQRRQRHVSRPEHPTGLLTVQHLDPRARVGPARFRRGDRVSRDPPGPRAFATRATRMPTM